MLCKLMASIAGLARVALPLGLALALVACDEEAAEAPAAQEGPHTDRGIGCAAESLHVEEAARQESGRVQSPTGAPQVVYLNRRGGFFAAGANDSIGNTSPLLRGPVQMPAFERADEDWAELLGCLDERFALYGVSFTDVEPSAGRYAELVVGGLPEHTARVGVGGMAPFDTTGCSPIDNAIGFVFSANLGGAEHLCQVAAHQIGHMLSLEHASLCNDPMSLLPGCGLEGFQDEAASCGGFSRAPCECRGGQQNTVVALAQAVGARRAPPLESTDLAPPSVSVLEPPNRQSVVIGSDIVVQAQVYDDVRLARAELVWAATGVRHRCPSETCTITQDRFRWVVKAVQGPQSYYVRAFDHLGRETRSDARTVFVTADGMAPPASEDGEGPSVELISPTAGADLTGEVRIEARVSDPSGLAGVDLVWDYTGFEHPCPSQSSYVRCEVEEDLYRWTVQVGVQGPRTFRIRARDGVGQESLSPDVVLQIGDSGPRAPAPPDVAPPPEEEDPGPPPGVDAGPNTPPEDPPLGEDPPPMEEPPPAPPPGPLSRPSPPNLAEAPEPWEGPEQPEDNGVATIEVLDPADGSIHVANGAIEIRANISDHEGVASTELIWALNGERYPCPADAEDIRCVVDGDLRHWTITVGEAGPRPFKIRARNSRGRVTTTPERSLDVRSDPNAAPPTVNLLTPGADAVWREDSRVEVSARIIDDGAVAEAQLLWDYNGNEYPCPHQSQYVDCSVDGDRYVWLLTVSSGTRAFQVRATDNEGNATLSERRSLRLE